MESVGAPRVQMVPTHYFLLISFDSMRDRLFWERQTTFGQLLFFFFFFFFFLTLFTFFCWKNE